VPEAATAETRGVKAWNDWKEGCTMKLMWKADAGNDLRVGPLMRVAASLLVWSALAGCGAGPDKQPLVWETIQDAAMRGDLADVKRHLARGAAVNAEDDAGNTPLCAATESGRTVVCKYLIAKGADVKTVAVYGRNLLHVAARNGHKDVAELLKSHGAKD
jgi:hypothetical protein